VDYYAAPEQNVKFSSIKGIGSVEEISAKIFAILG
jgi:adenylate kinase